MFLLVMSFALGVFPNILDPLDSGISIDQEAKADRIAGTMVANLSVPSSTGHLNTTELATVMVMSQPELRDRFGLPSTSAMNISVKTLDSRSIVAAGGMPLTVGSNRANETAASTARVVTLDSGSCASACRLVVKLW
jgi:hypothetical protein